MDSRVGDALMSSKITARHRQLRSGWDGGTLLFTVTTPIAIFGGIAVGGIINAFVDAQGPIVAGGLLPAGFLVWRAYTARFTLSATDLIIRNLVRTVHVPRTSLDHVTSRLMRPGSNMPAIAVAIVHRDGGPRLRRVTIAASVQPRRTRRREFADLLNEIADTDADFSLYEVF